MGDSANDWMATAAGAADFATIYRSVRDDVRAATIETMLTVPGFARFVARTTAAGDPQEAYARHWAGIEAALAGDWAVHEASIHVTASLCARLGVSLADWRHLMERTGTVVRNALFARLGTEPARLKDAVTLMTRFYDRAFGAFSDAYILATQERLQQSEALFQLTTIGQALVDESGTFVMANDAFLAMYAITPEQLPTRKLRSLFEKKDLARVVRDVYPRTHHAGTASYDAVHVRADGRPFPVHIEAVRITGLTGSSTLWGHSIYDLTERTQAELLRARSAELHAENERIRVANRAKSEFLANMSHELRTPLNSILGFSELLENGEVGPLAPQQLDFVHDIHTSGKHLLRLINDVLDLSKVEAGKLDFEPEDVDLETITRDAVQLSRVVAAARHVRVEVDVDQRTRRARLDPSRYRQVLDNFLSNAIKFSPEGSCVRVAITPDTAATFRLTVTDQGAGIAPQDLGRLFLVFEQLDAGRGKKHGGTGLGLALTRRLVEAQGGSVGVDSKVGVGSTFWAVFLTRPEGEPARRDSVQLTANANGPPVLVVDDDPASARLMAQTLGHLGFRALLAHDGEEGLALVRVERPVAVVLDLAMPRMNGFEFLRRYCREAAAHDVPVLVWTVKDLSRDERAELDDLAHAIIPKGEGKMRELVAALRSALGSRIPS